MTLYVCALLLMKDENICYWGTKKKKIGWLWVALQLYFLPYFLLLQRSPADILQTGLKIFKVPINKNAINLNMHLEFLF